MNWIEVSKANPRAKRMAMEHYSFHPVKSRPMGKEVGPPGQKIILLTGDGLALWGSHRPAPWSGVKRADGFEGPCCFIFRNQGSPILSSKLIREAVGYTASKWEVSAAGFLTYVAIEKVKSINPGYCFLCAGFKHNGFTISQKLGKLRRLIMPPDEVESCMEEIKIPLLI
jgi:hypothetical protein